MDPRLAAELELAALPHEELVRRLYRLALRRDPEPGALVEAASRLAGGTISRASLLRDLVASEEFERVRLLDDAIAFAEPAYLAGLVALRADELAGADLAFAEVPGMRSVQADVRALPFADGAFDVVLCISTLEHVGADNERYGVDAGGGGPDEALRELRRVGRRVLVTVPCGEPGDHGWFVQDEPDGWRGRFREAGFLVFEDEVYELGAEGWRSAPELDPAGVRYGERGPGASAVLCAELHPRTPGAVLREAARRVRRGTNAP
jgi:hypothetical protein